MSGEDEGRPDDAQVKVRRLRVISARTRSHRLTLTSALSCTFTRICGCAMVLMRRPPSRCDVHFQ